MTLRLKPASPEKVLMLFLHIQKAAGTSLATQARLFYGTRLASDGEYPNKDPSQLRNFGFVYKHIDYIISRDT